MKILSLNVQNFLRIEAVEIIPNGNTVKITGKNEQGKSSTLRALDVALGGGKAPTDPIHHGANKAQVVVELGNDKVEAVVTRTYIKRDGREELATLTVATPEGAKWDKPQEFLDKLLGSLSLDPVKFLSMRPEDQAKTVRSFSSYDFESNEKAGKADYDQRTIVNRDIKRLETEIAALPSFDEDWPTELIVTDELVTAIETATQANADIRLAQQDVNTLESSLDRHEQAYRSNAEEIEDLKAKLKRAQDAEPVLNKNRNDAQTALDRAKKTLDEMKPIDVQEARDNLEEADLVNDKVRDYKAANTRRGRLQSELDDFRKESEKLTKAIDDRKAAAAKAVSEAKMPVDGLGFDDDGKVTLNGFAFENVAFSKRLLTAIAIAAAHSPKLRLVKISEGDKLDDDAQILLAEFADKHDLQIWQETVQHGEPVGFVIEDGKLKGYVQ